MASSKGELPGYGLCLCRDGGTFTEDPSHDGTILRVHSEAPVKIAPSSPADEVPLQVGRTKLDTFSRFFPVRRTPTLLNLQLN